MSLHNDPLKTGKCNKCGILLDTVAGGPALLTDIEINVEGGAVPPAGCTIAELLAQINGHLKENYEHVLNTVSTRMDIENYINKTIKGFMDLYPSMLAERPTVTCHQEGDSIKYQMVYKPYVGPWMISTGGLP
jgi:hypothetical protein